MLNILLATLRSDMQCRPHYGLGVAATLCEFERRRTLNAGRGMENTKLNNLEASYHFGGKSVSERISVAFGRFNQDQILESGRCRATLTPT